MPMMMPPRNWLAAVLGFRMRPQSNEPRKRRTRTSPVTALTPTSANCAPVECMEYFICSSGSDPPASASTASRLARCRIEA